MRKRKRKVSLAFSAAITAAMIAWGAVGVWFVHHPRPWIEEQLASSPAISAALLAVGEPLGDFTDSLGLTGHDATVKTSRPAPCGKVLFAGLPVKRGDKAAGDTALIDRGEFLVGWSPKLRHPEWCAYHVPPQAKFEAGKRPDFKKDSRAKGCPKANEYSRSGYDRGHMVPNYAIATRFGPKAQADTFYMSNISPQSPALNRGVWRNVEHRIADLWPARWGEVWVIAGCISDSGETLGETGIDIPSKLWQIAVAQDGDEIRAIAVMMEQEVGWKAWPARYIVTIDEIEELTGLDFFTELDDEEEEALESSLPSRMWPVNLADVFTQLQLHGWSGN